jgi:hypothetical protein
MQFFIKFSSAAHRAPVDGSHGAPETVAIDWRHLMHVLIATFQLDGMTTDELAQLADEFARDLCSRVPGLYEKVFIGDPAANTYGGVYKFRDRGSLDAYLASEVWATVRDESRFANLTTTVFSTLEGPTRAAGGLPAAAVA